jgi:Ino eighty subunit 1
MAAVAANLESFASASSERSHDNSQAHIVPLSRNELDSSPARSHNGTRDSSAEQERNGTQDDRAAGRPSGTVSVTSSISGMNGGGNLTQQSFAQPPTAKKGPQSFFSGSKIKHLKKADGIPLWRSDIQFEFLQAVFHDKEPVFTNTYTREKGLCFADIYVDAMARSSKTSKILRDKLLTERENALNMAMVCLLVNVGRMNTTLNFFPEMKAQLRTYHAIPSLQAHSDSSAYKQLQDAPRLKSILKGACEDRAEPQTLDQIMNQPAPRTNPINLVFILSTYAPRVSESHFPENMDFYDLVMRTTLSSRSRARAFLWLMWLYLESEFTDQECLENPFGKGKSSRDKSKSWCVPEFEYLTEEQARNENKDTPEELNYGNTKQEERKRLCGEIQAGPLGSGRGRGRKNLASATSPDIQSPTGSPSGSRRPGAISRYSYGGENYDYDSDTRTRSVSPDHIYQTPENGTKANRRIQSTAKIHNMLNTEMSPPPSDATQRQRGNRPRGLNKRMADGEIKPAQRIVLTKDGRPLATPDRKILSRSLLPMTDLPTPVVERAGPKPRMTTHQMAVQQNRNDRVNHAIDRKLCRIDKKRKRLRWKQGAIARAWSRIRDIEEPLFASDDERPLKHHSNDLHDQEGNPVAGREDINENSHPPKRLKLDKGNKIFINGTYSRGPAGLIPRKKEENGVDDDYGEEAISLAAALRRTSRRLNRWVEADRTRLAAGLKLKDGRSLPIKTPSGGISEDAGTVTDDDDDEEMLEPRPVEAESGDDDVEMEKGGALSMKFGSHAAIRS